MKICFFSNWFNAHQLPLAIELKKRSDVDFTFVSLVKTDGIVGRDTLDYGYSFVLREYECEEAKNAAMEHALEDDVVVFGEMEGNEAYIRARAAEGRFFFRFSERLLKRGDWWRFAPPKILRTWNRFLRYKNDDMFVLCGGAYACRDLRLFGFPDEKCLKWGYFPDTARTGASILESATLPRDKTLCSAQRLIPCKRVDLQIDALARLKGEGIDLSLKIAGDGPERTSLQDMARRLGVEDRVEFLGQLTPDETSTLMSKSHIFLATSNRKEGWGATVNEAMAAGCCVVGSEAMGSVPYLIRDGINGFRFRSEDVDSLCGILSYLDKDYPACEACGIEAQRSVAGEWSAAVAADRLVEFSKMHLEFGGLPSYSDGPLSPAASESKGNSEE